MSFLSYSASVDWGPRNETPEELAVRALEAVTKICNLDPLFARWYMAPGDENVFQPLEPCVGPIAKAIAGRGSTFDNGAPNRAAGYFFTAYNFDQPKWTPQGFKFGIRGGSHIVGTGNSAYLTTADGIDVDLSLVTFSIFRDALLALADAFDASVGEAFSTPLSDQWVRGTDAPRMNLYWMTYLGPRFAHFANPPPSAIVERRPNGGLFMAATDDVFSTDDPEHMAVARDIQASVAPFNALKRPYPGLELPLD